MPRSKKHSTKKSSKKEKTKKSEEAPSKKGTLLPPVDQTLTPIQNLPPGPFSPLDPYVPIFPLLPEETKEKPPSDLEPKPPEKKNWFDRFLDWFLGRKSA